jgi:hypothetical protein
MMFSPSQSVVTIRSGKTFLINVRTGELPRRPAAKIHYKLLATKAPPNSPKNKSIKSITTTTMNNKLRSVAYHLNHPSSYPYQEPIYYINNKFYHPQQNTDQTPDSNNSNDDHSDDDSEHSFPTSPHSNDDEDQHQIDYNDYYCNYYDPRTNNQ